MTVSQTFTDSSPENITPTQNLSIGSKFNAFWVCLLIITQLTAVALATDWAIVTLVHLPFALSVILAVITAAGVVYCSWLAIKAAIQSERQYSDQI